VEYLLALFGGYKFDEILRDLFFWFITKQANLWAEIGHDAIWCDRIDHIVCAFKQQLILILALKIGLRSALSCS